MVSVFPTFFLKLAFLAAGLFSLGMFRPRRRVYEGIVFFFFLKAHIITWAAAATEARLLLLRARAIS